MSTRDARIQRGAVIAFAVVEALVIAAVLWSRTRHGGSRPKRQIRTIPIVESPAAHAAYGP